VILTYIECPPRLIVLHVAARIVFKSELLAISPAKPWEAQLDGIFSEDEEEIIYQVLQEGEPRS